MRTLIAVAAALTGLAWGAGSLAEDARSIITNPDWARKPTADEISRHYPDEAMDRSVSGRATVTCTVGVDGRLKDCKAVSEWPIGMGFGAAVEKMAVREFRMKPMLRDGKPVDGASVRIPIVFLVGTGSRYVILDPIWAKAPTFADMAAAWPAEAGELESGAAALRCRLGQTGHLRDCTIAGGVPKGATFGKAALPLTDRFQMRMTPEEAAKYANSDVILSFQFYNPATPAGQSRKVVRPTWISRIDPKKIVALFPRAAADKGVTTGVGVADCLVTADGRLSDCRIAREAPEGLGFGASAVAVASMTQMNPWTNGGRPVEGARIKLPITFNLAPEPEAEGEADAD